MTYQICRLISKWHSHERTSVQACASACVHCLCLHVMSVPHLSLLVVETSHGNDQSGTGSTPTRRVVTCKVLFGIPCRKGYVFTNLANTLPGISAADRSQGGAYLYRVLPTQHAPIPTRRKTNKGTTPGAWRSPWVDVPHLLARPCLPLVPVEAPSCPSGLLLSGLLLLRREVLDVLFANIEQAR